jgi:ankyrin repeat protein
MLFSHGAYVNATEPYYSQTPLMWACQMGHVEIVHTYLIQGAKVDMKDVNRWTAMHFAAYSNNKQVFDELRVADANLDAVNNAGDTSLHLAAQNNSINFVKALLEGGAYPSIQVLCFLFFCC